MATISRLKTIINGITHIFDQVALGGAEDSQGNSVGRVLVSDGSILAAQWESFGAATASTVGSTNSGSDAGEVDPAKFGLGQYGMSLSKAGDGSSPVFHIVIDNAGVHTWEATGGTVANLGGA